MITHLCDRCGRPIFKGQTRYVARLEVYAAPDVVEVGLEELLTDQRAEMDRLIEQCASMSEAELMQDVHVEMTFDLCRACQRALLANPLAVATED